MVNIERQVSDTAETGKVNHFHRDCTKQEGRHLPSSGKGQFDNVELHMARCTDKHKFAYNNKP
eukprot:14267398-Heterocapsa_arctica.AAC.1